jgi:hypothetical protein
MTPGMRRIPVVAPETAFPEGGTIYAGRLPDYPATPEPLHPFGLPRFPGAGVVGPAVFDGPRLAAGMPSKAWDS